MSKDFHEKTAAAQPHRFPVLATLAGLLWLLYGSLALLSFGVRFALSRAANEDAASPCMYVLPAIIAIVFMHVGWTTIRGRAKGLVSNGVGSIIWGGLHFLLLTPLVAAGAEANGSVMNYAVVLFPGGLLVAGLLALVASNQYQRWRNAKGYL